jgi:hypothetical protein
MTRALFSTAALFALAFTTLIVFIHTRPYQDGGLRAFLMPSLDCPPPCWLGIQPGVTTLVESSTLLRKQPSINAVDAISPATAWLRFSIPAVQRARVNMWQDARGIIGRLDLFETGLSLSDIQLVLGKPARLFLYDTIQYGTSEMTLVYSQYSLYISASIAPCQVRQATFWTDAQDVSVTVGRWLDFEKLYPEYYLSSIELDPHAWATQLRSLHPCV